MRECPLVPGAGERRLPCRQLGGAVRTKRKTLHLAPGNPSNVPEFPRWRVSIGPWERLTPSSQSPATTFGNRRGFRWDSKKGLTLRTARSGPSGSVPSRRVPSRSVLSRSVDAGDTSALVAVDQRLRNQSRRAMSRSSFAARCRHISARSVLSKPRPRKNRIVSDRLGKAGKLRRCRTR